MNTLTRLQELVEKYENGEEYAFRAVVNKGVKDETVPAVPTYDRREEVEVNFIVSHDSKPLNEQFKPFYEGLAPAKIPSLPMEMLFVELHKYGYDKAKIAELCNETSNAVDAFFARGVQGSYGVTTAIERLALSIITRPEDKWAQAAASAPNAMDTFFCPDHIEKLTLDPMPKDVKEIGHCYRYYCPVAGCNHQLLAHSGPIIKS